MKYTSSKLQTTITEESDNLSIQSCESLTTLQSEGDVPIPLPFPISDDERLPVISMKLFKEFSVEELSKNLQIRHDLVLDEECRIQNKTKLMSKDLQERNEKYWRLVEMELMVLMEPKAHLCFDFKNSRIYSVLNQIREMLLATYPGSDLVRYHIEEDFDLDTILKGIQSGAFDPIEWIQIWTFVIKKNCAPRRDVHVDKLLECAKEGKFMDLLRLFLELNNIMNLDLVNYELDIRRGEFETTLIADEKKYFANKFSVFKLSPNITKRLFQEIYFEMNVNISKKFEVGDLYLAAFMKLLFGPPFPLPETFLMDNWRIGVLRSKISNYTLISALYILFSQLTSLGNRQIAPEWLKDVQLVIEESDGNMERKLREFMITSINQTKVDLGQSKIPVDSVGKLTDKVMNLESKVRESIKKGFQEFVREYLVSSKFKQTNWLKSKGLDVVEKECQKLTIKAHKLFIHNWQVFGSLYIELNKQISN
jgi:hypothetical protein